MQQIMAQRSTAYWPFAAGANRMPLSACHSSPSPVSSLPGPGQQGQQHGAAPGRADRGPQGQAGAAVHAQVRAHLHPRRPGRPWARAYVGQVCGALVFSLHCRAAGCFGALLWRPGISWTGAHVGQVRGPAYWLVAVLASVVGELLRSRVAYSGARTCCCSCPHGAAAMKDSTAAGLPTRSHLPQHPQQCAACTA